MPQVTITLDLTPEAVVDLITRSASSRVVDFKVGTDNRALKTTGSSTTEFSPGAGRGKTPKLPSPVNYYRRQAGDWEGAIPGHRRPALNLTGMKLAWNLYSGGYSVTEIGRAFREILGTESLRRMIKKIASKEA